MNHPIDSSKTSPSQNSPTPASGAAAVASGIIAKINDTTNKLPSSNTGFLFNKIIIELAYLTLVPISKPAKSLLIKMLGLS